MGNSIELNHLDENGAYRCSILSLSGRVLFGTDLSAVNGRASLNSEQLSKGAYIIALKGPMGTSFGKVVMK